MSKPKSAESVKLIIGVLFIERKIVAEVLERLINLYGAIDFISPSLPFVYTDYYDHEMGGPIERLFASFATLMRPESLPDIKLQMNTVEEACSRSGKRKVNIDPGYISPAHLILATGKGYTHRPYLRDGIYADLTLVYTNRSFQTLPWTYPDYGEPMIRKMFNKIREKYILQLKMSAS